MGEAGAAGRGWRWQQLVTTLAREAADGKGGDPG